MSPKRRRSENRGLPKRWRYRYGAYYYLVPPGMEAAWDGKKEFRLGRTLPEAYRTWSERLGNLHKPRSMSDIMDRYLLEVVPAKSLRTQESNQLAIRRLRPVFGRMRPQDIQPSHAYRYFDLVAKRHGLTSARHDVATLRHILTKAVEWGLVDRNPLMGQLRLPGAPPRDRLVEDWEIAEALALPATSRGVQVIQPYIRFKLMTGLRRGDILALRLSSLRDDGIHVQPSKTRKSSGRRLIIEWTDDLRQVVDEILRIPPRRIGDAPLFVTREGKPYIDENGRCNAFDSLWQRFMARLLAETRVTERFQERDLRAKVASDSDTLVEASERLGHADTAITQRVYRRKPVRVRPLKQPKNSPNRGE